MAYGSETPANRSATQYGSTNNKPKAPKKGKGKGSSGSSSSGGSTAPKAPTFDWGDGRGKVHTIPRQTHQQNVEAQQYGINLDAPLASPIDARTALGEANAGADREYGPQISALQGIQSSLDPWYQQYIASATAAQTAAQNYAQPLVNQANAWANQAPQAAPGIDPSSPAYGQSQQAGQSGQGLAQLGAAALSAIPAALTSYLSGAQAVAAKDLPQAKAYYGEKVGEKQAERGSRVQELYGQARTNEQNYGLAAGALNLNTAKSQADVDIARGVDPVTHQPLPKDPEKPITSGAFAGLTGSQVTALPSEKRQELIDNYNSVTHPPKTAKDPDALTPQQKRAAAAKKKKHLGDVAAATGKVRNQITDIIGTFNRGGTIPDKTKPADPVTQAYPDRKATPAEMKGLILDKYKTLGEIALAVREGKKLTTAQIDYLHHLDKNFRVPREWISGAKPSPAVTAIPGVGNVAGQG